MVCLDMASYNIVEEERDFFAQLLQKTDIVFANEQEARAFTGKAPREAMAELAGICSIAVVKTGADGAMAQTGGNVTGVPGQLPARSTTPAWPPERYWPRKSYR